jgi:hypothetical protein
MRSESFGGGRWRRPMMWRAGLACAGAIYLAALAGLAATSAGASVSARAARTLTLNESGRLHLTSHHGFTLNEQGTASGTIRGAIYIHLNVSSTNHVTAEVNIYPSGGSLTGKASAAYHVHGATASFNGTMNIVRGSGTYKYASATGLSFTGTVQRSNDAVSVKVTGGLSY